MKTNLKNLFLILAVAVPFLFTSCESDDPTGKVEVEKTAVSLQIGQSETVAITEGNGNYTAVTSSSSVATVKIGDDKESVVITAVGEGTATITVSGKDADAAIITVTVGFVPNFANGSGNINVAAGDFIYYKQGNTEGTIEIKEASATKVELILDGKTAVSILDDAGTSYLQKDGTTVTRANVVAANLLLAKKSGEAMLCTGGSDQLNTKFESTEVVFVKKP